MFSSRYFPFLLLITFLFSINAIAQPVPQGNGFDGLTFAKTYFQNTIGENSLIYTGKEYKGFPTYLKGHPFFITDQMNPCEISYDGNLYENIPMLFDIVSQKIVVNRYHQDDTISLLTEKIKYFILDGHRFENLTLKANNPDNIQPGIFEILLPGEMMVIAKRIKNIRNGRWAADPISFVEEDEYFIQNTKRLFQVYSRSSLLEALFDKKEAIKIFTRKNHFRFKKNIEKELLQTVAFYSNLN